MVLSESCAHPGEAPTKPGGCHGGGAFAPGEEVLAQLVDTARPYTRTYEAV